MTTSIPLESDSLSPPMCESLPCPVAVERRVTMRNSPVCGLMNVISISVLLLADLLLRGVTFFPYSRYTMNTAVFGLPARRRTYQNRLFRGVLGSDIHLPVDRWGHTRPEQSLAQDSQGRPEEAQSGVLNVEHLQLWYMDTPRFAVLSADHTASPFIPYTENETRDTIPKLTAYPKVFGWTYFVVGFRTDRAALAVNRKKRFEMHLQGIICPPADPVVDPAMRYFRSFFPALLFVRYFGGIKEDALAFVVDSLTTRSAMERHVEVEDEMFLPKGCKRFIGLVGNGERVFRGSPSVEEGLVILRKLEWRDLKIHTGADGSTISIAAPSYSPSTNMKHDLPSKRTSEAVARPVRHRSTDKIGHNDCPVIRGAFRWPVRTVCTPSFVKITDFG
ncbi:hypothetical protein EDD16DRAFT_1518457 [Pisolithus croceorrhizus]|nr:hypothetical protein EDD16DRAFT_1518457 [Pisolithus croceorrhizus]